MTSELGQFGLHLEFLIYQTWSSGFVRCSCAFPSGKYIKPINPIALESALSAVHAVLCMLYTTLGTEATRQTCITEEEAGNETWWRKQHDQGENEAHVFLDRRVKAVCAVVRYANSLPLAIFFFSRLFSLWYNTSTAEVQYWWAERRHAATYQSSNNNSCPLKWPSWSITVTQLNCACKGVSL